MERFHTKRALRDWLSEKQAKVGFIPTMGALHAGHLSLIERSCRETDITIASIYVNPTQFNDPTDFEQYPQTLESDLDLLCKAGCDGVYIPSTEEIYPKGTGQLETYDLGDLEYIWEGKYRPGHFQGVCAVVHRLLDAVCPDALYMGLKDFQQIAVIRRLIELTSFPVKLIGCQTKREENGLALSSRNARLSDHQRLQAAAIYAGFKQRLSPESFTKHLLSQGFDKIEYIAYCDAVTLLPTDSHAPGVMLVAAWIGGVRLIDNFSFNEYTQGI